ncbi:Co/Zn/Cd efflux system component [Pseudomonas sp. SORGH_AS199]|uniref:cation diffusion facilitator family transporter n=1 Tax=Pseudomonas sp. SORGH_AS_0199 TaxID=3041761 RepID=UPI002862ED76|nr:cation diffusion facilitator family transporter [Pseudomonas sp. SORGH_AS_0199]MDR6229864.1 Co/Zn/Cd efflux system component [Pseudomonas sp. SORGH_AS_0199]
MDSCCEDKASELAQLRGRQSRVLYSVLAINAVMFLVEFAAGWLAGSTALLGDSLDMFGDASVYALTLFVLHRSDRARAGAALVKGGFMLLFGVLVITDAVRKVILQEVPQADWMGTVGLVALLANTYCFYLLHSHRADDLNMRSTWICSRNDLVANTSVVLAAILVAVTGSLWPDVLVGLAIAALFLHSAWQVSREAYRAWRIASEGQGVPVQELQAAPMQAPPVPSCCGGKTPAVIVEPGQRAPAASCCAADSKGTLEAVEKPGRP